MRTCVVKSVFRTAETWSSSKKSVFLPKGAARSELPSHKRTMPIPRLWQLREENPNYILLYGCEVIIKMGVLWPEIINFSFLPDFFLFKRVHVNEIELTWILMDCAFLMGGGVESIHTFFICENKIFFYPLRFLYDIPIILCLTLQSWALPMPLWFDVTF